MDKMDEREQLIEKNPQIRAEEAEGVEDADQDVDPDVEKRNRLNAFADGDVGDVIDICHVFVLFLCLD